MVGGDTRHPTGVITNPGIQVAWEATSKAVPHVSSAQAAGEIGQ